MTPETEAAIRLWSASAEGWCPVERALKMAQLVIDYKPAVIVEIGVFAGGSLIPQALALKEVGTGTIYGIDPWSRQAAVEQVFTDGKTSTQEAEIAAKWWTEVDLNKMHLLCMEGIWHHGLEPFAIVLRARSEHVYDLFRTIHILYIDGSHSEVASCRDVELYLPKVSHGGFVWFDDANWATTQKALGLIEGVCDLIYDGDNYRLYRKE
jgi:cephalosporin hydroxylase